jgi:hypothetical protein
LSSLPSFILSSFVGPLESSPALEFMDSSGPV